MVLVDHLLEAPADDEARVLIRVDRRVLEKRLFRAKADDGLEFGFDLAQPLRHGACVYRADRKAYVLEQMPEPVLKIPFASGAEGARFGWMIGNLHFPAAMAAEAILVEDDSAVRQMLERNGIVYSAERAIFQPLAAAGHHHHAHGPESRPEAIGIWRHVH